MQRTKHPRAAARRHDGLAERAVFAAVHLAAALMTALDVLGGLR